MEDSWLCPHKILAQVPVLCPEYGCCLWQYSTTFSSYTELEKNNVCASFFFTTFVYKKLTTHLNLVLRLKVSGAILYSSYMPSWHDKGLCCQMCTEVSMLNVYWHNVSVEWLQFGYNLQYWLFFRQAIVGLICSSPSNCPFFFYCNAIPDMYCWHIKI